MFRGNELVAKYEWSVPGFYLLKVNVNDIAFTAEYITDLGIKGHLGPLPFEVESFHLKRKVKD